MLRLVLRICARLLHTLELILMRYLDWSSSIEELWACIWWCCCKLRPNYSLATRLSATNAPWTLALLQHSISKHLAIEESHVTLILIVVAIVCLIRLELSHEILSTGWTGEERICLTTRVATSVWLRPSQVIYQLSSAPWTFMSLLQLFLNNTDNILIEIASFLFRITSHALGIVWLRTTDLPSVSIKL